MRFKEGVRFALISPHIMEGLDAIDRASRIVRGEGIVITSMNDGKHMTTSKHYTGEAGDIRIAGWLPQHTSEVIAHVNVLLGYNFDLVLEKDHIHLEYDPK